MNRQNGGDPRPVIPATPGPTGVVNDSSATPKESPLAAGSLHDLERDDANTNAITERVAASGAATAGVDMSSTTSNPKQGAAPAWAAEDVRARDFSRIERGWSVFGADGEQLGEVTEIGPGWFAVPYGTEDAHTMYVPQNYIEAIANRRVVLSQPAGLLIDMKLDAPPANMPEERGTVSGVPHDPRRGESGGSPIVEAPDLPSQAASAVSTRMAPPPDVEPSTPPRHVNAREAHGHAIEERSGYTVLTADPEHEPYGGPTHQPGVLDRRENSPNRTQLSHGGTAGEGKERNVTDLDLARNKHVEGDAFDAQEKTIGRPLAPGEPSAAQRSLPR